MSRESRSHRAAGPAAALVLGAAAVLTGVLGIAACLTAPPADLPVQPPRAPSILHSSVVPPTGVVLDTWPDVFIVPVRVDDPNTPFFYDAFIDYNPDPQARTAPQIFPTPFDAAGLVDGGVVAVPVALSAPDPAFCHRVEILVAHRFNSTSPHTPDSIGGDSVAWLYTAGGGPNGCPAYDAGALQDGAFPQDASPDGLPVTPEEGGGF
jgi:hypothetical protein